jgi:hypothetical protein
MSSRLRQIFESFADTVPENWVPVADHASWAWSELRRPECLRAGDVVEVERLLVVIVSTPAVEHWAAMPSTARRPAADDTGFFVRAVARPVGGGEPRKCDWPIDAQVRVYESAKAGS